VSVLPPDAWVPVQLRWRWVRTGDVFFSPKTGDLWSVVNDLGPTYARGSVLVRRGARSYVTTVDPDDAIAVLVPVVERDALALTRAELGARLVGRRSLKEAS
jgi:hypothetical protein